MKAIVLITMILAVMAPVVAQTRLRLYECYSCGQQKQADSQPSPYEGQCYDKHTGKKKISHTWARKN